MSEVTENKNDINIESVRCAIGEISRDIVKSIDQLSFLASSLEALCQVEYDNSLILGLYPILGCIYQQLQSVYDDLLKI